MSKDPETAEVAALREAAEGLLYPSESDEPFDVVNFGPAKGSVRDAILARAGARKPVEDVPIATFFDDLAGADDEEGFERLCRALESHLTDLHVLRVGTIRVDVYVAGRAAGGDVVGLHTVSIET